MLSSDDLSVFFDPEEHGEAVRLDGTGGLVAIWDEATADAPFGDSTIVVDSNLIRFPRAQQPQPFAGAELTIERTGQQFVLVGEPRLTNHGSEWICEAQAI